ncbi:MAG: hypothetical protein R2795_02425 [Saprospiraceae bacterium]
MRYILPVLLLATYSSVWAQLTCEDEFLLSGTATLLGECIQMTANTTGQQGCAWFHEETDFSQPFTHVMQLSFGTNDAGGADGICLVYQSNSNTICGLQGGGIGALGIPNSFIIEFDTWQNSEYGDPVSDHAAININGNFNNTIDGPVSLPNLENGNQHTVSFSWDPATNTYTVVLNGSVILSGVFDIINNCFGGQPLAFWGYTASTGAATNLHLVCPGLPPFVVADAGPTQVIHCEGSPITLDGSSSDTGSEFSYQWSTLDGNIVAGDDTLMPEVDAPGTYTLTVYNSVTMCESSASVNVEFEPLYAEIESPPFLDCTTGEVTLDGTLSSSGNGITYEWSTSMAISFPHQATMPP